MTPPALPRRLALAAAGAGLAAGWQPLRAQGDELSLPRSTPADPSTLRSALARRRSVRRYGPAPLTLAELSALLWAAQGVSGEGGLRTAPSAGALYPLELYLLPARVQTLAAGVYHYRAASHALRLGAAPVPAADLQAAARGQAALADAAAVLLIAAVPGRTAARYGARTDRYVAFEAGAAAQNVALQAAALGLGTVVIGAFDEARLARLLALPAGTQPIVLMPLGRPA